MAVGGGYSRSPAWCSPDVHLKDGSNPAGSALPSQSASVQPGNTEGASSEQIQNARLDECPASDPAVPARPDGLPDLTLPCLGRGNPVRLSGSAWQTDGRQRVGILVWALQGGASADGRVLSCAQ